MTDKEFSKAWITILIIAGFILGLAVGGLVTGLRYDSEIRTDQLELKEDIAEIKGDKAAIKDVIDMLLFQIEQLKKERQELRELKITWSKDLKK